MYNRNVVAMDCRIDDLAGELPAPVSQEKCGSLVSKKPTIASLGVTAITSSGQAAGLSHDGLPNLTEV